MIDSDLPGSVEGDEFPYRALDAAILLVSGYGAWPKMDAVMMVLMGL
jgi:hypothetical protein